MDEHKPLPYEREMHSAIEETILDYRLNHSSLSYGVVIDALTFLLSGNTDLLDESYLLSGYAKSEKFRARMLKNGKWRDVETGGPSKEKVASLEAAVKDVAAKLSDVFQSFVSQHGSTNEDIQTIGNYLRDRYKEKGCFASKGDAETVVTRKKISSYEKQWLPILAELHNRAYEYGLVDFKI